MDKKRYLRELAYHLRTLPSQERTTILETYEDHFKIGAIDGKNDQDIVLELGQPKAIAEKELAIRYDSDLSGSSKTEEPTTNTKSPNVAIIILLLLFNLIFVLGPAFGLFGILIGGWAVSIAFISSPILWSVSFIWGIPQHVLSELSILLILFGIGIFVGIAMYYATRFSFQIGKKYFNWMNQLARG